MCRKPSGTELDIFNDDWLTLLIADALKIFFLMNQKVELWEKESKTRDGGIMNNQFPNLSAFRKWKIEFLNIMKIMVIKTEKTNERITTIEYTCIASFSSSGITIACSYFPVTTIDNGERILVNRA